MLEFTDFSIDRDKDRAELFDQTSRKHILKSIDFIPFALALSN